MEVKRFLTTIPLKTLPSIPLGEKRKLKGISGFTNNTNCCKEEKKNTYIHARRFQCSLSAIQKRFKYVMNEKNDTKIFYGYGY